MALRFPALFAVLPLMAAEAVIPSNGPKPVGPYTPGVLTKDFLYVSGQGARRPDGADAGSVEARYAQCFENVKAIIEAGKLTMEHVVYMQVYLEDVSTYPVMDAMWKKYFPKNPPARASLGVARMPTGTPIEISAVAIRDLSRKKAVIPQGYPATMAIAPAIIAGDRVFLSGFLGRDVKTGNIPADPAAQVQLALDRMKETLKAAGLDFRHMVFVNPYLSPQLPMNVMNNVYAKHFEFGNTPARATIQVASLPYGANIEFTGVAVRNLKDRRAVRPKNMPPSPTASPCVQVTDTLYCSAKSGFIPGPNAGIYAETVETQVRQTMRNLLDGLEEAGMDFTHVVATNVYLDQLDEFAKMNGIYAQYFTGIKPTRTTVQPTASVSRKANDKGQWPKLEEISLVAVK
ncbi:MAG: RidA family protein [Bryobacteraceae bacterium]|nr:RidA family protein [Bryobacteraceae bacterium]